MLLISGGEVYSAVPGCVELVIVDGQVVVEGGRVQTLDILEVVSDARAAAMRIGRAAGLLDRAR